MRMTRTEDLNSMRLWWINVNDPQPIKKIQLSDEAEFFLNESVSRQNCRYWVEENPHWIIDCHFQYPQKVNIWAGIKLKLHFYWGKVNWWKIFIIFGEWSNKAFVVLYSFDQDPDIQQDGVPHHYEHTICDYLDQVFTNRWIGKRLSTEWPAKSIKPTYERYWKILQRSSWRILNT